MAFTAAECLVDEKSSPARLKSQITNRLSFPPEASISELGEKANPQTSCLWPLKQNAGRSPSELLRRSFTCTDLSLEPEAICVPAQEREPTLQICDLNMHSIFCFSKSSTFTLPLA